MVLCLFSCLELTSEDSITFTVYDEDWGKTDDFLGSCTLRFEDGPNSKRRTPGAIHTHQLLGLRMVIVSGP